MSPLAGKSAPPSLLVDVPRLVTAYYADVPDPSVPSERVAFGTSGHRGSALTRTFNEWHVLAISQAICQYRAGQGITGPLFLGIDTHALSAAAFASALEVLAANGVEVMISAGDEYTPTPAVSHAILVYNRGRTSGLADGIVVTPSHNPPEDGGFKYNPPNGGPADETVTGWIGATANALLEAGLAGVHRVSLAKALRAPFVDGAAGGPVWRRHRSGADAAWWPAAVAAVEAADPWPTGRTPSAAAPSCGPARASTAPRSRAPLG